MTVEGFDELLEPSLLVVDFKRESNAKHSIDEAKHAYSFQFPRLRTGARSISMEIRSDPAPNWKPDLDLKVPFFTARHNRLYVISVWIQSVNDMHSLELGSIQVYVPSSTFDTLLDSVPTAGETKATFEWGDWGPGGTRMLQLLHPLSAVWVCYVFGSRHVAPVFVGDARRPRFAVHVYDFNQLALRIPASRRLGDPYPPLSFVEDRTPYVTAPTIFAAGRIFEDTVWTSLPYRVQELSLDSTSASVLDCAVMCSEDSLIVIDVCAPFVLLPLLGHLTNSILFQDTLVSS